MYSKQDLVVSAPFYHAPMASGVVYVYSGKQVYEQLHVLHIFTQYYISKCFSYCIIIASCAQFLFLTLTPFFIIHVCSLQITFLMLWSHLMKGTGSHVLNTSFRFEDAGDSQKSDSRLTRGYLPSPAAQYHRVLFSNMLLLGDRDT